MKKLSRRVKSLPLIISNLLFATTVYANPFWTEKLVYTTDNITYVVGESEWSETKYEAFQSAFLDGLNKINVMQNTEIETTYIEKVYDGKITAEEFSTIQASNSFGEIVVKDSAAEREHVSDLHRVFVLLQVLPQEDFFDFSKWLDKIINLLSFY